MKNKLELAKNTTPNTSRGTMYNMKTHYLFDLDDTLRLGVNSVFLNTDACEQQIPLPHVVETLHELKTQGKRLFIASNQGIPSFAKVTELQIWKCAIYFNDSILGGVIEDIKFDFYHPEGPVNNRYVNRRKPKPDLILELVQDYSIEKKDVLYVGNAPSDKQAAENAGVDFAWAHDFFGWEKNHLELSEKFGFKWKKEELRKFMNTPDLLHHFEQFLALSTRSKRE